MMRRSVNILIFKVLSNEEKRKVLVRVVLDMQKQNLFWPTKISNKKVGPKRLVSLGNNNGFFLVLINKSLSEFESNSSSPCF